MILNDDGDLRKKAKIRKKTWDDLVNGWGLLTPITFENVVLALGGDSEQKKKIIREQLFKCHLAHQSPNKKMDFTLHIKPEPCPRPRFSKWSGAYMPKSYRAYQKRIGALLDGLPKIDGLMEVDAHFYFATQNHPFGYHCNQKDIDNLLKGLFDAFQQFGLISDDKYIHTSRGIKYWYPTNKIHVKIKYNDWYKEK